VSSLEVRLTGRIFGRAGKDGRNWLENKDRKSVAVASSRHQEVSPRRH
jgi:hypothetical protein